MVELKGYPIIYPSDGLYYIYSKESGKFWRQLGKDVSGGLIDCDLLGPASTSMDNRIWKIATVNAAGEKKRGPRITLQNIEALQRSFEVGGYISKKKGKVVQTGKKTAWTLIGDCTKPFAYKITTDDYLLSINAPSLSVFNPSSHLEVAAHITAAYDKTIYDPQWWYFIPIEQIDQFLAVNEIRRLTK